MSDELRDAIVKVIADALSATLTTVARLLDANLTLASLLVRVNEISARTEGDESPTVNDHRDGCFSVSLFVYAKRARSGKHLTN